MDGTLSPIVWTQQFDYIQYVCERKISKTGKYLCLSQRFNGTKSGTATKLSQQVGKTELATFSVKSWRLCLSVINELVR